MSIPVFVVKSVLSPLTAPQIEKTLDALSEAVGEKLEPVSEDQFKEAPFGLLYIATGGSEGFFKESGIGLSGRPVYLLTRGSGNSLAAAMECLAYLKQHGETGEILHGSMETIAARIRVLKRLDAAAERLDGARVASVGKASDWLIASGFDREIIRQKLGVEIVDVPIERLEDEYRKDASYPDNEWTKKLLEAPFDRAELEKALGLYGALDRICHEDKLDAITLRCFDLIPDLETTGCLALSILNASGTPAGCEGDMPALLTMLISQALTGAPGFMCNPSRFSLETNIAIFAHCTLPLNMPTSFELDTHYESGIGAALRGKIPEGKATLVKFAGDLSRCFISPVEVLENLKEPDLCRTQVRLRLPDLSYFLTDPIQNHHVLLSGDHVDLFKAFAKRIDCDVVDL